MNSAEERRQLTVKGDMSFREKQEELEVIGVAYKLLYLESYADKLSRAALFDVEGGHRLILARARALTVSFTPAERDLASMLAPRPDTPYPLPGERPWKRTRS